LYPSLSLVQIVLLLPLQSSTDAVCSRLEPTSVAYCFAAALEGGYRCHASPDQRGRRPQAKRRGGALAEPFNQARERRESCRQPHGILGHGDRGGSQEVNEKRAYEGKPALFCKVDARLTSSAGAHTLSAEEGPRVKTGARIVAGYSPSVSPLPVVVCLRCLLETFPLLWPPEPASCAPCRCRT